MVTTIDSEDVVVLEDDVVGLELDEVLVVVVVVVVVVEVVVVVVVVVELTVVLSTVKDLFQK